MFNFRYACRTCALLAFSATAWVVLADSTVGLKGAQLQRIDGFGASDAWYAWEIHSFPSAVSGEILDTLFSPISGAGLSLLRHRVPPGIEPTKGTWDWTTDDDTVWLQNEAAQRGLFQAWSTVWSPPPWMKSNASVNNGGSLLPSHYADYATFLVNYVEQYQARLGVAISAISIQNEPDINAPYESCNWTGQQFHDFIAGYLMPLFRAKAITAKVIMPEASYWSDGFAQATLQDAKTAAFVDVIASHDYAGTIQPLSDALQAKKAIWETEVSNLGTNDSSIGDGLGWAETIHHTLVDAQANAWHYWWLYSDASDTTGQSLISGSPSSGAFTVNKRLWTIGNFSRFVRPGDHMVALTSNYPEAGVYVSAFASPTGGTTIVAINANSVATNLTVVGSVLGAKTVSPFRTSATESLAPLGALPVAKGAFTSALPPMSVTTFVRPGIQLKPGIEPSPR